MSRSRSEKNGKDIQERLVAAAEKLFIGAGYGQTSIDALVREAATSKREFYRYFSGKEDLLVKVSQRLITMANSIAVIPQGNIENEVLPEIARRSLSSHLEFLGLGVLRASIVAATESPELARQVYLSRTQPSDGLANYLSDQIQASGLTFDDPKLAALRFGFLAVDGLRYTVGAPAPTREKQLVKAVDVTRRFLHGHVSAPFRRDGVKVRSRLKSAAELRIRGSVKSGAENRTTRLSETRWQALYDIAWTCFEREGYVRASINEIAEAAGVARTTIYRRHSTKQDLFLALSLSIVDRVFARSFALDWLASPLEEALGRLAHTVLDAFLEPTSIALQRMLIVESSHSPEVTSAIYDSFTSNALALIRPVMDVLEHNEVLDEGGAGEAAWSFFVLTTFGGRFLFVPPANEQEQSQHVAETVALFLYGCRRPGLAEAGSAKATT